MTVSPSNIQNVCQTHSKKRMDAQVVIKNFTIAMEVLRLISQSHWSLLHLANKPKKFDFVHQTVSRREAHVGWARD